MPEGRTLPAAGGSLVVFNALKDVEWKIGVTTSSSNAAQVGQTFVQVKMMVETGSSDTIPTSGSAVDPTLTTQAVQVEMSVPKFYAFLNEMEKVKASLGMFK